MFSQPPRSHSRRRPGLDNGYGTGRWRNGDTYNSLGYTFTVPDMDYLVTLKFADPLYATAGKRIFNASINGATTTSMQNIDVAGAGGQFKPYDITVPVSVTGGQITIALTKQVDTPLINAIEIVAANSIEVLPRTVHTHRAPDAAVQSRDIWSEQ